MELGLHIPTSAGPVVLLASEFDSSGFTRGCFVRSEIDWWGRIFA